VLIHWNLVLLTLVFFSSDDEGDNIVEQSEEGHEENIFDIFDKLLQLNLLLLLLYVITFVFS